MKRLLVHTCGGMSGARAVGTDAGPAVQQGNSLYQQGKFAEAVAAYEAILQAGYTGGELSFNLGNAYYKQGNMGKAILHFERALRFLPADDDVRHNLQLANLQIVDRIDPAPRLFLWDMVGRDQGCVLAERRSRGSRSFIVVLFLGSTHAHHACADLCIAESGAHRVDRDRVCSWSSP